jgi:nitronate monooxygenase
MNTKLPVIIQGGMGVAVSDWFLAKTVAQNGQLGVVSGTAIDTVLIRRLQMGDPGGQMRRAMAHFPVQSMIKPILAEYFIEEGKSSDKPFKLIPLPSVDYSRSSIELLIVANFVEVYLAKEGHSGVVGINYLQKIQMPTLPSLFGAMLAGVDFVLMGAGLPLEIPGILDTLSQFQEVQLTIHIDENPEKKIIKQFFNPKHYIDKSLKLKRPLFLAIVSSHIAAKTMIRRATGNIDGFIVENHQAGGHNAPPRTKNEDGTVGFGTKDNVDLDQIKKMDKPFWMAGSLSSNQDLLKVQDLGAQGIQVGTMFAYCKESGIVDEIKTKVFEAYRDDSLEIVTDFNASPTGYPFKLIKMEDEERKKRPCDLGYLRHSFVSEKGNVSYRCPSENEKIFVKNGGSSESAEGKLCLCNGLLATVGLGQVRHDSVEPPMITAGESFDFLKPLLKSDKTSYSATDVIDYLLAKDDSEEIKVSLLEDLDYVK